jgi:hypothetical protein
MLKRKLIGAKPYKRKVSEETKEQLEDLSYNLRRYQLIKVVTRTQEIGK